MILNIHKAEPEIRIIDQSFDADHPERYQLYVNIADDGMSMAVMDASSGRFVALQSYPFNQVKNNDDLCERISGIFDEDLLLSVKNYRAVNLCYGGSKTTLVPDPLFSDANAAGYLSFNHTLNPDDNIYADDLKLLGAKNIFAIPGRLENVVKEKFPQISVHHSATAFIESLLLNNKNRDEKMVTVHIHLSGFELAVSRRNELIFFNRFQYQSSEDFIYYVLFTLEQLQLNPETIPFIFTGEAETSSALFITARKYIRHVRFAERSEHFSAIGDIEKIAPQYHYILFNQHLCAS
jgi:hypothetical protein